MPRKDRMSGAAGPTGDRIRVGFVSAQVHRHSVWDVLTRGWLTQLDRRQFDVTCYHVGWRRDRETALARKSAGNFVMGPRPLSAWVERIKQDRMDVLIYPEIGMDPMTVKLAALRLAPVQCVAWGHPITSGLPTMDYFLSADLLEPPDAEGHYSETLVRLPNLGCYFEPLNAEASRPAKAGPTGNAGWDSRGAGLVGPAAPDILSSRGISHVLWVASAGRRTSRREDAEYPRFICCQQVAKYHPEHDQVFVRIAQEIGRCRFTFVELARTYGAWERFRRRLGRVFAGAGLDIEDYCAVLPTLPRSEFLALLKQQDVCLDTLSFSGFTTAIQALSCAGLPVVTLNGELMRQRLAAGILRHIGIADTIAGNVDEYVEIAVKLARDPALRADLRARISASLVRAYRDESVIRGLETFLRGAVG